MITHRHVLTGLGILFGLFSVLNYILMKALETPPIKGKPAAVIAKAEAKPIKATEPSRKRYPLVPADPAQYGIVSVEESRLPQTQDGWKTYMAELIQGSKILDAPEGQQAMDKAKITPEEFQETMQRVDKKIEQFEEEKRINPWNLTTGEQLETLYKVKALGLTLRERVATLPAGQETPEQTKVRMMWTGPVEK